MPAMPIANRANVAGSGTGAISYKNPCVPALSVNEPTTLFPEMPQAAASVDPGGSTDAAAWGISGNNVVGSFTDSAGTHGFLYEIAPVPEPATFALFAIGIAGMAGYAWRRRQLATVSAFPIAGFVRTPRSRIMRQSGQPDQRHRVVI